MVDPSHGLYNVTLDGKEIAFEEGWDHVMDRLATIISVAMETNASSLRVWSICKGLAKYHQLRCTWISPQ